MGRKKLSVDIKKTNITIKLRPEMIKKLHDISKERNMSMNKLIEECLSVLNKSASERMHEAIHNADEYMRKNLLESFNKYHLK